MIDAGMNVLWGKALPSISIYDDNWEMISEWRFTKLDNFRMEISCAREFTEKEMENGQLRQRLKGFRMFVDFQVSNIENRDLMLFLRQMWTASHILLAPHYGTMKNPNTGGYDFEFVLGTDFMPQYFDGRFIGHNLAWNFKSLDLLIDIPRDSGVIRLIPRTPQRVGGVDSPDRKYSLTYFDEKMIWGGWELTADDRKYLAYFEQPEDPSEIDDYGKLW